MSAQVVSLEEIAAAKRVGEKVIPQDTCVPIVDIGPEDAAVFLKPMSWAKRRVWLDSILSDSLVNALKVQGVLMDAPLDSEEGRVFVRALQEKSGSPVHSLELIGGQHAFDIFHSVRSAHAVRAVTAFLEAVHAEHSRSV